MLSQHRPPDHPWAWNRAQPVPVLAQTSSLPCSLPGQFLQKHKFSWQKWCKERWINKRREFSRRRPTWIRRSDYMATHRPGKRVFWDIEGSIRLAPETTHQKSTRINNHLGFLFIYCHVLTCKRLLGLHYGQAQASYFDTCSRSEGKQWQSAILSLFTINDNTW